MRTIGGIVAILLICGGPAGGVEDVAQELDLATAIECLQGVRLEAKNGTPSLSSLERAAERGDLVAQSTLGCMYAEGLGVTRRDLTAYGSFRRIADEHADDSPYLPQARLVANAFVALGQYYLRGIANSDVMADPARARDMFAYAASYFGDADAQYYLARFYLDGRGSHRDPRRATRWLGLAANKGQHKAQAVLGHLLFSGDAGPGQAAPGLMWLTIARDSAGPDEEWIADAYEAAFSQASENVRAAALVLLQRHLRGRSY